MRYSQTFKRQHAADGWQLAIRMFIGVAALAVFVVFSWAYFGATLATKQDIPITCASFSSQPKAQEALSNNPRLDADNDGVACQDFRY